MDQIYWRYYDKKSYSYLTQCIWLSVNKFLPYLIHKDISTNNQMNNKLNYLIVTELFNISEFFRKYFKYREELGEYPITKGWFDLLPWQIYALALFWWVNDSSR